jgi:hypothetical protein
MLRYGNTIPDSVREFIITSELSARREKCARRKMPRSNDSERERERERERKKREEKERKKRKEKSPADAARVGAGTCRDSEVRNNNCRQQRDIARNFLAAFVRERNILRNTAAFDAARKMKISRSQKRIGPPQVRQIALTGFTVLFFLAISPADVL